MSAACRLDRVGELGGLGSQFGGPEPSLFGPGCGEGLQPLAQDIRSVLGAGAEQGGELVQQPSFRVEVGRGAVAGEGFHATEVGADGQLGQQAEGSGLGAVGDVGAAAQFAGAVAMSTMRTLSPYFSPNRVIGNRFMRR